MDALIVICTFPDAEIARRTATALVSQGHCACVNLVPAVESIYRWEGKVETAHEVLALCKTTRSHYPALESALLALHPYDVPEIIAVPIAAGLPAYLQWLAAAVGESA